MANEKLIFDEGNRKRESTLTPTHERRSLPLPGTVVLSPNARTLIFCM